MININTYITEKFRINDKTKLDKNKYHVDDVCVYIDCAPIYSNNYTICPIKITKIEGNSITWCPIKVDTLGITDLRERTWNNKIIQYENGYIKLYIKEAGVFAIIVPENECKEFLDDCEKKDFTINLFNMFKLECPNELKETFENTPHNLGYLKRTTFKKMTDKLLKEIKNVCKL